MKQAEKERVRKTRKERHCETNTEESKNETPHSLDLYRNQHLRQFNSCVIIVTVLGGHVVMHDAVEGMLLVGVVTLIEHQQ